jgi:hypothetical protein
MVSHAPLDKSLPGGYDMRGRNKVEVQEINSLEVIPETLLPLYKFWRLVATGRGRFEGELWKGDIIADVYSSERDAKLIAGWIDSFVEAGGLELDI